MRLSNSTFVTTALAFVLICPPVVPAQTLGGTVRGEVLDASGGLLPGVTVTVTSSDGRVLATTYTDQAGRFQLGPFPVGAIKIGLQLHGFDTATREVKVQSGAESWVSARLPLAQITEQVVVFGKAPRVEPSTPRAPEYRPPPPVVVIPVPIQEMESICKPAKPYAAQELIGTIASHRHVAGQTLYVKGDELNIQGGRLNGLAVGRNLVVRRHFRANSTVGLEATGEHTAGLVQIVRVTDRTAVGVVLHACNELMEGDFLASFAPEPVRPSDPSGAPAFGNAARILFADAGQLLGAPRRLMVIDRGSLHGVHVGQRFTLFRGEDQGFVKPVVIGEAVIVEVRADSATIRVERATDAIWFGDWAAPQQSPFH